MEQKIQPPTIARMVYVYADQVMDSAGKPKPFAAVVADVHPEGSGLTINAMVIGHNGDIFFGGAKSVSHVSEKAAGDQFWWDWMGFQKGQQAKAEELETELQQMAKAVAAAAVQGGAALSRSQRSFDHVPKIDEPVPRRGRADGDQGSDLGKLQADAPSPVDGKR